MRGAMAAAAVCLLTACGVAAPPQPVGESSVRVSNELEEPIIVQIPHVQEVDPALGTVSRRTRQWRIDPSGSGPDAVADSGGLVTIFTRACEIVTAFVLTRGTESRTLLPDGTLVRDAPQLGE